MAAVSKRRRLSKPRQTFSSPLEGPSSARTAAEVECQQPGTQVLFFKKLSVVRAEITVVGIHLG